MGIVLDKGAIVVGLIQIERRTVQDHAGIGRVGLGDPQREGLGHVRHREGGGLGGKTREPDLPTILTIDLIAVVHPAVTRINLGNRVGVTGRTGGHCNLGSPVVVCRQLNRRKCLLVIISIERHLDRLRQPRRSARPALLNCDRRNRNIHNRLLIRHCLRLSVLRRAIVHSGHDGVRKVRLFVVIREEPAFSRLAVDLSFGRPRDSLVIGKLIRPDNKAQSIGGVRLKGTYAREVPGNETIGPHGSRRRLCPLREVSVDPLLIGERRRLRRITSRHRKLSPLRQRIGNLHLPEGVGTRYVLGDLIKGVS